MRVLRIVQLLCPSRHCFLALAYESADGLPQPEFSTHLWTLYRFVTEGTSPEARKTCGICGSGNLQPEDRPTKFQTKEEALPFLEQLQREQELARRYWSASRG